MKHKQKNLIIAAVVVLLVIAGGIFAFKDQLPGDLGKKEVVKKETPNSVTIDFYNKWLDDVKSTTTSPFQSGLINNEVLSSEVRAQIERANKNKVRGDVDPVLCQIKIPNRIDVDNISTTDNKAVVVVKPRDKRIKTEHQAVVGLTLVEDKWLITKIDCMVGEMMVEKEFDFEKSGVLLKDSIEAPYSKDTWHLVYEQETQTGFVVPLTFDAGSICIGTDKTESPCDPTKLTETTKVFVQAGMTETGAIVKRMTFE